MAKQIRSGPHELAAERPVRGVARGLLFLIALGISERAAAGIADLSAPTLDRSLTRENFFDWVDFDPADVAVSWPGLIPEETENRLTPYVGERFAYDDNIYRLPSVRDVPDAGVIGVRHDNINTLSAAIDGTLSLSGQQLELIARVDDNRFLQHSSLDNVAGSTQGLYGWSLGSRLSGQVGGSYGRGLTDFTDYYLVTHSFVFTKDIVTSHAVFGTAQWQLTSGWSLAAGLHHTDTSQTADPGDEFKGDAANGRVAYETVAGTVFAWDFQYEKGTYGRFLSVDGVPVDRDFREQTVRFEFAAPLADTLHLLANAGYLKHDYPQASGFDFAGGIWDATLVWQSSPATQLLLTGSRRVYADIDAESQYFVSQGVRAIAQWTPTARLKAEVGFSREDQRFIGPNQTVATLNIATRNLNYVRHLNLAWSASRAVQVALSGRFSNRDSNAPVFTYDDALVSLSVRARF